MSLIPVRFRFAFRWVLLCQQPASGAARIGIMTRPPGSLQYFVVPAIHYGVPAPGC